MAIERADGSQLSSNTPSPYSNFRTKDMGIYRCMLTNIRFVDDEIKNENFTDGSKNPQLEYDAIIVGGINDGRTLTHIRDATSGLGGDNNYAERVLKAATKKEMGISKTDISKNDGDIVYISFLDGDPMFPIILGHGTQFTEEDNTGATKEDGPRLLQEYNGVLQFINKDGEFSITRKGGELDTTTNNFEPGEGKASLYFMDKEGSMLLMANDGSLLNLNAKDSEISLIHNSGHLITMTDDEITISHSNGTEIITMKDGTIQITGSDKIIEQSATHSIDTGAFSATAAGEAEVKGGILGGALKINSAGLVALGNSAAELLDLVDQLLTQLIALTTALQAETHIGNLGFPTLIPINSPTYLTIQTSLTAIKVLLNLIKGTL